MTEFEKYFETYKDMLQIIRNKYRFGINYSFKNVSRTFGYREPLNEETIKLVYVMFCKHLFENKEYDQHAHNKGE
jgi:hypothetical protein